MKTLPTISTFSQLGLVTGRNEAVAKVMFLLMSVILFTGGSAPGPGGSPQQTPPADTPSGQIPLGHTPLQTISGRYTSYWNALLPPVTKVGQGYVFTGMCDSVHRGVSASVHAGIHPPGADPKSRHPQSRHPWEQTHPLPGADTPPAEHAGRYGQRVGGTHPTGMHSCSHLKPCSRLTSAFAFYFDLCRHCRH